MTSPTAPAAAAPAVGPLASMTGFARAHGHSGAWRWTWEVRSVNAKGLDVRLRLANGLDMLEPQMRAAAGARFSRGSISATLSAAREGESVAVSVNGAALEALVIATRAAAAKLGVPAPGIDALLSIKGIVDVSEAQESATAEAALGAAVLAGFDACLEDLAAMRHREGESLRTVLADRLSAIEALVAAAEALPDRTPAAIKERIAEQVRALTGTGVALDADRLHQEAILIATKADIREELDRLTAHIAAARELIAKGGPVGRRLDFLAQEFNREANTLCSKSNSVALTQIGLDLKLLVDQFREQIQNIE